MKALRIVIPLALGAVAGLINFFVMRSMTSTLDLVVVREEVRQGTELTDAMLDKEPVRADVALFRSAVPWSERGLLLRRRVNRTIGAREVVFFRDVRGGGEEVRENLRPGEISLTVPVRLQRMAPGIQPGDEVAFLVLAAPRAGAPSGEDAQAARRVGPFRVLGMAELGDATRPLAYGEEPLRKLVVAVPDPGPTGKLDAGARLLEEALRGRRAERVLAAEFYRQGARK
jgi:hypothetical protein